MSHLRRLVSKLIPHIVTVRNPATLAGAPANQAMAYDWWRAADYASHPRRRYVSWMGFRLIRVLSRRRTLGQIYSGEANDTVRLIEELQSLGLVGPIRDTSSICEAGSNIGRNLLALYRRFACSVVGMDISPRVIAEAARLWESSHHVPTDKWRFICGDGLDPATTATFADGSFDLVLTRWHLVHIPLSDAKRRYVEELKRISRSLVLMEPVPEEISRRGTIEYYREGRYCLSFDVWDSEYGLTRADARTPIDAHDITRVYVWRRQ